MLTLEAIKYFQLGMGYYVVGRFAVHARFSIIAGNLCHHAIELFLKGKLVPKLGRDVLKNKFGHNLPTIWEAFKSDVDDQSLSRFDHTIRRLHAFEDIRYPGKGTDLGAQISVTIGRPPGTGPATGPYANVPNYDLVLGDIDELVRTLIDVCTINSDVLIPFMQHNVLAHEFLEESNASFGVSEKVNDDEPRKSTFLLAWICASCATLLAISSIAYTARHWGSWGRPVELSRVDWWLGNIPELLVVHMIPAVLALTAIASSGNRPRGRIGFGPLILVGLALVVQAVSAFV